MVKVKRNEYKYSVDLFIDLLQQITKRNVNYRCNDADEKSWLLFIEKYPNANKDFITKFIEYGFQSWFNDGSQKDYSRTIRYAWIFGGKAIERWQKNDTKTNVFITRTGLKTKVKLKTRNIISSTDKIVLTIRKVEEDFKREYFNTKRGFLWCRANTTLFHHKSSFCAICLFKTDCKILLKKHFPRTYQKRGYE